MPSSQSTYNQELSLKPAGMIRGWNEKGWMIRVKVSQERRIYDEGDEEHEVWGLSYHALPESIHSRKGTTHPGRSLLSFSISHAVSLATTDSMVVDNRMHGSQRQPWKLCMAPTAPFADRATTTQLHQLPAVWTEAESLRGDHALRKPWWQVNFPEPFPCLGAVTHLAYDQHIFWVCVRFSWSQSLSHMGGPRV